MRNIDRILIVLVVLVAIWIWAPIPQLDFVRPWIEKPATTEEKSEAPAVPPTVSPDLSIQVTTPIAAGPQNELPTATPVPTEVVTSTINVSTTAVTQNDPTVAWSNNVPDSCDPKSKLENGLCPAQIETANNSCSVYTGAPMNFLGLDLSARTADKDLGTVLIVFNRTNTHQSTGGYAWPGSNTLARVSANAPDEFCRRLAQQELARIKTSGCTVTCSKAEVFEVEIK